MLLDDEARIVSRPHLAGALRLGRLLEVALGAVLREVLVGHENARTVVQGSVQ
jgi:hypothetical protein